VINQIVKELEKNQELVVINEPITDEELIVLLEHPLRDRVSNLSQVVSPFLAKGVSHQTEFLIEQLAKADPLNRSRMIESAGIAEKIMVQVKSYPHDNVEQIDDSMVSAFAIFIISEKTKKSLAELEEDSSIDLQLQLRSNSISIYEEVKEIEREKDIRKKVCSSSAKLVTGLVGILLLTSALTNNAQAADIQSGQALSGTQYQVIYNNFKTKMTTLTESAKGVAPTVQDGISEIRKFKSNNSGVQFKLQQISNAAPEDIIHYLSQMNVDNIWTGDKAQTESQMEVTKSSIYDMVRTLKDLNRNDPSLQGMDFSKVDALIQALDQVQNQLTEVMIKMV
jgi:hypothetical protein